MVITTSVTLSTRGFNDYHNLTTPVAQAVRDSGLKNGTVTIFTPSATSAITTVEYESGMLKDLTRLLEQLAPQDGHYHHNDRWHDGNGFSHVRAALLGPSLSVPFTDGLLLLGTWQAIAFIDFDNNARNRQIFVQIIGE